MQVVTLLNRKGGVGKTSCTHHLSATLAGPLGKRVLVIDADPQASLTQGWWGPDLTDSLDPSITVAAILGGDRPDPGRVIHETPVPGLRIVPGSPAADALNNPTPLDSPREFRDSIRDFLDEVRADFDLVLVDCPPNLYGCSFAALAGSDHMIVPVQPEDYGAQGIAKVLHSLDVVRGDGYPVDLMGFILTMVQPRRTLHRIYESNLRAAYGSQVFEARMPELPEFPEAIAHRTAINLYKPKGAAAKAVRAIAEELLARVAGTYVAPRGEEGAAA